MVAWISVVGFGVLQFSPEIIFLFLFHLKPKLKSNLERYVLKSAFKPNCLTSIINVRGGYLALFNLVIYFLLYKAFDINKKTANIPFYFFNGERINVINQIR